MQIASALHLSSGLAFLLFRASTIIVARSNEIDRLALLATKSQLHDPLGVTSSWNTSVNLCQWRVIACGRRHKRVTKLDFGNQSIGGFLSPNVGNLSFLRYIFIADNGFQGENPSEFGRLFRLEYAIPANNSFSDKNQPIYPVAQTLSTLLPIKTTLW